MSQTKRQALPAGFELKISAEPKTAAVGDPMLLLILIPVLIWRYARRIRKGEGSLRLASTISLEGVPQPWTVRLRHALLGLKMLALALAIIAFYMNLPVEIDEESLKRIAEITGGLYYRATDKPSLEHVFAEIGRLETTKWR